MANTEERPQEIIAKDANAALQDLANTIKVITRCLKSADLDGLQEQIKKELPALFGASKCMLFVRVEDSGPIRPLSTRRENACPKKECFRQLRDCLPAQDQWLTCHDICDEPASAEGCLVLRLMCLDSEAHPQKDAEEPVAYLCLCGLPPRDDLDMTQLSEKARLVRDILGPHIHSARLYQQAHLTSLTDVMTGVGSRKLIEDRLEQECLRTQRYGRPLSLAIMDLDNFKVINDVLGHVAGDDALTKLAECLKSQKRQSDVVARYGGDEFVILMPETTATNAAALLERLRLKVKSLQIAEDVTMTVSSGIAQSIEDDATTPRELFRRADVALYEAKNAGRDCVVLWDRSMSKQLSDKDMELEKIKKLQRRIAGLSEKSETMFIQSIWGLVQALEAKDAYSKKHSENVTAYATKIAELMGMGPREIEILCHAAMIHDIGKIGVPDAILAKPGKLTRRERRVMEQHPLIAVQILEKMTFLEREVSIVRHHHEAWNGQGYPDGLAGSAIPIGSRILAVADTLDALTSDRPYRQSYSVDEAAKILLDSSAYDFDPQVVEAAIGWIDATRNKLDEPGELKPEDLRSPESVLAEI